MDSFLAPPYRLARSAPPLGPSRPSRQNLPQAPPVQFLDQCAPSRRPLALVRYAAAQARIVRLCTPTWVKKARTESRARLCALTSRAQATPEGPSASHPDLFGLDTC